MCNSSKHSEKHGGVFPLLLVHFASYLQYKGQRSLLYSSYNYAGVRDYNIREYTRHSVRRATTQSSLLLATRFAEESCAIGFLTGDP